MGFMTDVTPFWGAACYSWIMNNLAFNPAYAPTPIIVHQCGGAKDLAIAWKGEDVLDYMEDDLRMADINDIAKLTIPPGLLDDIRRACVYDRKLIDDPNGITLADKLTLTSDEKKKRKAKTKPNSFEEMIKQWREGDDELAPAFSMN